MTKASPTKLAWCWWWTGRWDPGRSSEPAARPAHRLTASLVRRWGDDRLQYFPGSQERTRQCIPPRNGGLPCSAALEESRLCGTQACPGALFMTKAQGTPQDVMCLAEINIYMNNNVQPVNHQHQQPFSSPNILSEWTAWSSWSSCSVSCGGGLRQAERRCLPVGSTCPGSARQEEACEEQHCPGESCFTFYYSPSGAELL